MTQARSVPDGRRARVVPMAQEATQEEVLEAARSLGGEFTREDVADKLDVEVSAMQPSWKAAKQAGRLEKVREEGGKRHFRLIDH